MFRVKRPAELSDPLETTLTAQESPEAEGGVVPVASEENNEPGKLDTGDGRPLKRARKAKPVFTGPPRRTTRVVQVPKRVP